MFDKKIPFKVDEYQVIDAPNADSFEKVARVVDFPPHVTYDPDFLYLWVRIVSGGEYYGSNKNGDYFPLSELVAAYETFRDAHPFKNHENKEIEKAIGRIFDVRYDEEMKTIEVFKGIDKKRAPEIVRGYLKGYLTDVSMGCKVPYTVCSVCGNKARRANEFCDHVKKHKLEYLPTGERVYEINYEPRFHDSSAVLNGAERVAKAFMIIDTPPEGSIPTFKKVAGENGASRFIPFTETELEKIASHREALHPMLLAPELEKTAETGDFREKLAELEKEVSGKLVRLIGDDTLESSDKAAHMMKIIRFLTDERFDDENLSAIASTLKELAKSEGLPVEKVFSTFLGVAELLGITLYPKELHTIMQQATGASLLDATDLTPSDKEEAFPSDVTRALDETEEATKLLPRFNDPGKLLSFYDKAPFEVDAFRRDPLGFLGSLPETDSLDEPAPRRIVETLHKMLAPVLPSRSGLPEHLLPRLTVVITGNRPLIGNQDAADDLSFLRSPRSMGDLMGALAYKSYETMRPTFRVTRLVKMADETLGMIEKTANIEERYKQAKRQAAGLKDHIPKKFLNDTGVGRLKLLAATLPAAYVASAFMKSKDSNGEQLSSAERFAAEHPAMIGIGASVVGKPATALAAKAANGTINTARKGATGARNTVQRIKNYATKEASVGRFNAFGEATMEKIAREWGVPLAAVNAVKTASLLEAGEFEKEAADIRAAFGISDQTVDTFLERMAHEVDQEIEKAAEDFTNNFLIDSVADIRPLSTSLPGRMVDAFVMKKLMGIGKDKDKKEGTPDGMANASKTIEPPRV